MKKGQPDKRESVPNKYKPAEWLIKAPYLPQYSFKPSGRSELYEAVGKALSTWEVLECVLMDVFVAFMNAENRASAREIYGAILVSSARLNMLRASAKANLNDKDFADFNTLTGDIAKLNGFRNQIAHGTVASIDERGQIWTDCPDTAREKDFILTPPVYNTNKVNFYKKQINIFILEDIQAFFIEAKKLQVRTGSFVGIPFETKDPEALTIIRTTCGTISPEFIRKWKENR